MSQTLTGASDDDTNTGGGFFDNIYKNNPDIWRNLMDFGAHMATAASQRTGQGFLANPTFGSALGQGVLGAEQSAQARGLNQSKIGLFGAQAGNIGAETTGRQLQNLQLQRQIALQQMAIQNPEAFQRLTSALGGQGAGGNSFLPSGAPGTTMPGGGGGAQTAGNESDFDQASIRRAISSGESPNNPAATNQLGYLGSYQFGAGRLNELKLYQPAQGEDIKSNAWNGMFTIPGFAPMTRADFVANPKAQDAAMNIQATDLLSKFHDAGLNQYYGQTRGGVPINPVTAVALGHIAGPDGMVNFVRSDGKSNNSPDANGTTPQQYALRAHTAFHGGGGTVGGAATGQPGASGLTPDAALAQATQLTQRAQQLKSSAALLNAPWLAAQSDDMIKQADQLRQMSYDITKAGQTAWASVAPDIAKNQAQIQNLRPGGLSRNPQTGEVFKNPELKLVQLPDGSKVYRYMSPDMSAQGGSQGGVVTTPPAGSGAPSGRTAGGQGGYTPPGGQAGDVVESISPQQGGYLHERGHDLAEQRNQVDTGAAQAVQSNFLFDQMRHESESWPMGKFAEVSGEANKYALALAQQFGIKNDNLTQKVSDYEAFYKNMGQIVRQATRETSSRAAFQEMQLIQESLPSATMSKEGFHQIADQGQALNDYQIAKQKVAQQYEGHPQDFAVDFNSKVTPGAFLINRMAQTPDGQKRMSQMVGTLQKTEGGRQALKQMLQRYQYAKQNGLFDVQ